MTRATTTIPFSTIKFIDNIPRLSDLTERLTQMSITAYLFQKSHHRFSTG